MDMTGPMTSLAEDVVEQVMRCCDDVDLAGAFPHTPPGSTAAAALLGRLLAAVPTMALVAGSPLCVWVRGGTLDPEWRAAYPPAADSAYAHLSFLTELYTVPTPAPGDGTDAVGQLLALSGRAAAELATS